METKIESIEIRLQSVRNLMFEQIKMNELMKLWFLRCRRREEERYLMFGSCCEGEEKKSNRIENLRMLERRRCLKEKEGRKLMRDEICVLYNFKIQETRA